MLLWRLAEHRGDMIGCTCSRSACTYSPRYQCTADHANPIELPPYRGATDTSDKIKECRSLDPKARPTARKVSEILSSQSNIKACPRNIVKFLNAYTYLGEMAGFSVSTAPVQIRSETYPTNRISTRSTVVSVARRNLVCQALVLHHAHRT